MEARALPDVAHTGLSGLAMLLSPPKALLARRIVASGRTPDAAEFDKQGLRL